MAVAVDFDADIIYPTCDDDEAVIVVYVIVGGAPNFSVLQKTSSVFNTPALYIKVIAGIV